ncbi:hypothetical protein GMB86_07020 [Terrilactibacillus sp. BCM23-1]|uniref:Membrane-spanning protein n=1 Tax=Terrilactibacillus tamarindi TaxID=2599694 RepID=A0A6N8CNP3_9BACI|nr:hypothetical protein [Terrilactibacillus tamarindi]MTT31764.1 hypothetical protein [Terrilactibacillus tamarindi]
MKRTIVILLSSIYVIFMACLTIYYFINNIPFKSFIALSGILCGGIPLFIAVFTRIPLNLSIIVSYLIFLIGAQYFGSIKGWFGQGSWDTFIHLISGPVLAFVGRALNKRLLHQEEDDIISPWFVFLSTLSIVALGGVIWEIYEFCIDHLFGTDMQIGGNSDTLTDLIADTVGGFIISIWAGVKTKIRNRTLLLKNHHMDARKNINY